MLKEISTHKGLFSGLGWKFILLFHELKDHSEGRENIVPLFANIYIGPYIVRTVKVLQKKLIFALDKLKAHKYIGFYTACARRVEFWQ